MIIINACLTFNPACDLTGVWRWTSDVREKSLCSSVLNARLMTTLGKRRFYGDCPGAPKGASVSLEKVMSFLCTPLYGATAPAVGGCGCQVGGWAGKATLPLKVTPTCFRVTALGPHCLGSVAGLVFVCIRTDNRLVFWFKTSCNSCFSSM